MIYVFVVDTSASMNQVFSHGLSYLDCAKSGIEHFFQWEQRRSDRKGNKYVLIDYSDPPGCIKAGVHDSIPQLLLQLKTLNATDISNPGKLFTLHLII
ncbi:DEAD/H box polypeptide 26B [Rhizoclosmatium globosum]|uniref:DEAD/H box polypeptide 26B n=1 Tax=Rhizoclosmatium globosum TaxID=329046 RepID=A0A1Y2C4D4_9FUNG|nr:DEAD/H box polypeptide 26B [Rhizoclosmatium globosum]|eukprot:ORY41888.1 DEAD/H box polypeptide 26B [Rhizoclosmatium globosum]